MSATNPLATIWDALQRAGCEPHGQAWDFRSKCPAHNADSRDSLHVVEGVDRRAVMHCFAHGCDIEEIVEPLGLDVRALFPSGHHRADRRHLKLAQRSDFDGNARVVANALAALTELGDRWRVSIDVDQCPYCESPHAQLVISPEYVIAYCEAACTPRMFCEALAGRLADQKKAAA